MSVMDLQRTWALIRLIKACQDDSGNPKAPSAEELEQARYVVPSAFMHGETK